VLQERAPLLQLASQDVDALLARPPRDVLTMIGTRFLETFSEPATRALLRLIMGEALRQPDVAQMVYRGATVHLLNFLYRYLEKMMERGEIRQVDLGAAARCFMGPLFLYMFTTLVLELPEPRTPSPDVLIETTVETFLQGMAPADA
jgi:hypothetical protein